MQTQNVNKAPQGQGEATQNIAILHEIELVRNPKTGKGWVYNLTDDVWMRAINPQFAKNGVVWKGIFSLQPNKKYLVKIDESSWKNSWETYKILTVENGAVKILAEWNRNNGNYKFADEKLQQHFINFSASMPQTSSSPDQQAVKVNVLEFAKYLAKVI